MPASVFRSKPEPKRWESDDYNCRPHGAPRGDQGPLPDRRRLRPRRRLDADGRDHESDHGNWTEERFARRERHEFHQLYMVAADVRRSASRRDGRQRRSGEHKFRHDDGKKHGAADRRALKIADLGDSEGKQGDGKLIADADKLVYRRVQRPQQTGRGLRQPTHGPRLPGGGWSPGLLPRAHEGSAPTASAPRPGGAPHAAAPRGSATPG